jgi:hypothetical protein
MIVFNTIIGLGFFAFLYIGMLWRTSFRWRYLADFYAGDGGPPLETRRLQAAVLIGPVAYESLHGIVNMSAHETGVGLRMMLPFSLFRKPLFIPYGDIEGWETTWYLDAPSTELSLRRAPDVKIVMSKERAEWLAGYSGRTFTVHDVPPPQGKAGQGWRRFVLGVLIYMAIGLVTLLGFTIWKWAPSWGW